MKNKRYGFTLLEVILTLALIGIVIPLIYSLFFSGQKSFKLGTEEVYEQQDHRQLRDYLVKELRYIDKLSDEPLSGGDYEKYYSLELEDNKIIKAEYKNSDSGSTDATVILSSIEEEEIHLTLTNNILAVKYKYKDQEEDQQADNFVFLLENSEQGTGSFKITKSGSDKLYYAMTEDIIKR